MQREQIRRGRRSQTRINYPRRPVRQRDLRHHQVQALQRFREWDQAMQRRHGQLYYRAAGYSVH